MHISNIVTFKLAWLPLAAVLGFSTACTVVNVLRSDHWYKMTGFRAGIATLTFDLWGAIATLQVEVR